MSNDTAVLNVTKREEVGKAARRLRREGIVPANIYERGKESQAVKADAKEITKVFKQVGKHSPVELVLDGKKHLAMIKDVDFKVGKDSIIHIAFHSVNRNETVEAEVPVRLDGDAPAERLSLMVLQHVDIIKVEALPANLPEELVVDANLLTEDGSKVTVADIKAPEKVKITSDPELMLFSVEVPKDQIAAADEALEEANKAEEIISSEGDEASSPDATE